MNICPDRSAPFQRSKTARKKKHVTVQQRPVRCFTCCSFTGQTSWTCRISVHKSPLFLPALRSDLPVPSLNRQTRKLSTQSIFTYSGQWRCNSSDFGCNQCFFCCCFFWTASARKRSQKSLTQKIKDVSILPVRSHKKFSRSRIVIGSLSRGCV